MVLIGYIPMLVFVCCFVGITGFIIVWLLAFQDKFTIMFFVTDDRRIFVDDDVGYLLTGGVGIDDWPLFDELLDEL